MISVAPDLAAALLASRGRELVVSHASAARLYDLPKPLAGWGIPQFTARSGPPRRRSGTHVRVAPLPDSDVVLFEGLLVTKPARTVLDCVRTLPPADGLAMLDAALRRGIVTMEKLLTVMDAQYGWPGMGAARQVVLLGSDRRESPLESWTAWSFHTFDVPRPEWQMDIFDQAGRFIGRVDGWWPGVAGEADGRSKYALAAAERGGAGATQLFSVLEAERQREQNLRDCGVDVVRWNAADVLRPERGRALAHRIGAAIAFAQEAPRFTGAVAPAILQLATARSPRRASSAP